MVQSSWVSYQCATFFLRMSCKPQPVEVFLNKIFMHLVFTTVTDLDSSLENNVLSILCCYSVSAAI